MKPLLLCLLVSWCVACGPNYVEISVPALGDASLDTGPDSLADERVDQPLERDAAQDVLADTRTGDRLCGGKTDGAHCGEVVEGSNAQLIHRCEAGQLVETMPCAHGCDLIEGTAQCLSDANEPCFNDADGEYCGGYIGSTSKPQSVFTCQGQRTVAVDDCADGCDQGRCKMPPSSCVTRPPGTFVRGFNACGGGGAHHGIDYGAAQDTPIPVGVSGVVSSLAEGHPNCPYNFNTGTCPSYCINNFNYVKIKVDGGNPNRPGHDLYVYYLHVSRVAPGISDGVRVNKGDVVGYVGNSGCSTGPHIHLEAVSVPTGERAFLNTCSSVDPASLLCP